MIDWKHLVTLEEVDGLEKESFLAPVVVFKHSSRCSISALALNRFVGAYKAAPAAGHYYMVDVVRNRDVSSAIAQRFGVRHESPQVIVLHRGKPVYHASHSYIRFEDLPLAA